MGLFSRVGQFVARIVEKVRGESEEDATRFPDDFPDDWGLDVGESDGGDEGETDGYDYGSISAYQVIVYY